MLLLLDKSDLIIVMIKYFEVHEARSHLTLINNIQSNSNHKNKDGNLKTILSIWYFKRKRFPDVGLTKHKSRICAHGGIQQWVVRY